MAPYLCWNGRGVPDNDGGGTVVQCQGVRVGTAQAGAVVADESSRQKPHHKS